MVDTPSLTFIALSKPRAAYWLSSDSIVVTDLMHYTSYMD